MAGDNTVSSIEKNLNRVRSFQYALLIEAIAVGVLTGVVVGCFRWLLGKAENIKEMLLELTDKGLSGGFWLAVILFVIAVCVTFLLIAEPEIGGSGIPQVEGELRGHLDMNWSKVLSAKFAGCALTIGSGLALGREGPSIQLGAMIGKGFARRTHRLMTEERLLLTCGAGAGISAAFGAPLAGAIFALEELHQTFSALVLITTLVATAVSDYVAIQIVGVEPVFDIRGFEALPAGHYWVLVVLGLVLGLLGFVYNNTIELMQNAFGRLAKRINGDVMPVAARMAAIYAIVFAMYYIYPTALGSGSDLVGQIGRGDFGIKALAVLLIVKLVFSTGCFGSGAPGGIFLPLLVLGAISGGLCSRALTALCGIDEKYIGFFVVISMAGLFASIVRAPATGIILITEMTGEFSSFLSLVIVSLIAYTVADLMGSEPIYEQLWNRRMRGQATLKEDRERKRTTERKVILYQDIHMGSYIDGRMIKALSFPKGSLIVAVLRDGSEFIPAGDTLLKAGDRLEILCRASEIAEMKTLLKEKCQTFDEVGRL